MNRTIAEENSILGAYNWKISRGDEAETRLQGYVKPQFSKPGHTISFHASSELDQCQLFLRIYRLGSSVKDYFSGKSWYLVKRERMAAK